MTAFVLQLADAVAEKLARALDAVTYWSWKRFQNGNEQLHAFYQAVSDTDDSLDAINSAVQDGDCDEALRLIKAARESLTEHIEMLRGLL